MPSEAQLAALKTICIAVCSSRLSLEELSIRGEWGAPCTPVPV
jgi:hypothetical protein